MHDEVEFQSLKLYHKYTVQRYFNAHESPFGGIWILEVSEEKSGETLEVIPTMYLMEYIINEKPKKKFSFTVKLIKNEKYPVIEKYPAIEGYNPREWTKLE